MTIQNIDFSLSNFNKENTPPWLAKVGNYCLLLAAVGGLVSIAPISAPIVATIGAWTAFVGAIGKLLSKTGGTPEVSK